MFCKCVYSVQFCVKIKVVFITETPDIRCLINLLKFSLLILNCIWFFWNTNVLKSDRIFITFLENSSTMSVLVLLKNFSLFFYIFIAMFKALNGTWINYLCHLNEACCIFNFYNRCRIFVKPNSFKE